MCVGAYGIVRSTCCVIDLIPLPIIYTHNGDGTFQNLQGSVYFIVIQGVSNMLGKFLE